MTLSKSNQEIYEKFSPSTCATIITEIVNHKISINQLDRCLELQNKLLEEHKNIEKLILKSINIINSIK